MTTRIVIDPNVRVRGQLTFAGLEDVEGSVSVGQTVEVREPESGLVGQGRVVEIDLETELVYLGVDWHSLVVDERASVSKEAAVGMYARPPRVSATFSFNYGITFASKSFDMSQAGRGAEAKVLTFGPVRSRVVDEHPWVEVDDLTAAAAG